MAANANCRLANQQEQTDPAFAFCPLAEPVHDRLEGRVRHLLAK
jgi:hypothetical protein